MTHMTSVPNAYPYLAYIMDMTDDNMLHSTADDAGDDDFMCPAHLMIQKDGNLVVFDKYDPAHTVSWASNTMQKEIYPPHVLYFRVSVCFGWDFLVLGV